MNAHRNTLFWIAGLLLCPAFFFSITGDLPHIFILTALLLGVGFTLDAPYKMTDRALIYSLVTAAVLAVLFDYVFPLKEGRFGFLSFLLRPGLIVALLLYTAALAANFAENRWRFGLAAAAALATLMFGSDIQAVRAVNFERIPGGAVLIENFRLFYTFSTAATVLFFLLGLRNAEAPRGGGNLRFGLLLFAFLLLPVLIGGLYWQYKKNEPAYRRLEIQLLRSGMRRMAHMASREGLTVFSNDVNLNMTLTPEVRTQSRKIVFRVVSKQPPGYLRGRVFTRYEKGMWTRPPEETRPLGGSIGTGMRADKTFRLKPDAPENGERFDIFADASLRTNLLFYPGNALRFELLADQLHLSTDGMLEGTELLQEGGVSAFALPPADAAGQIAAQDIRTERYLAFPTELDGALRKLATEAEIAVNDTDAELFRKYSAHLLGAFRYSLEPAETEGDPVEHFLLRRRAGHCELFASALTLALRRHGVPSRYVTGFICEERHPFGEYFLARLGNAHAWVEAYDRGSGMWVRLEPTPPVSPLPEATFEDNARTWADYFSTLFRELMANLRRGRVADGIVHAVATIWNFMWWLLVDPLRGGGTILLAGLFIRRWLRRRKKTAHTRETLRNMLRHYCRFRKLDPAKTACELAKEAPESDGDFLRLYQKLRYSAGEPAEEELAELVELSRRLTR